MFYILLSLYFILHSEFLQLATSDHIQPTLRAFNQPVASNLGQLTYNI